MISRGDIRENLWRQLPVKQAGEFAQPLPLRRIVTILPILAVIPVLAAGKGRFNDSQVSLLAVANVVCAQPHGRTAERDIRLNTKYPVV